MDFKEYTSHKTDSRLILFALPNEEMGHKTEKQQKKQQVARQIYVDTALLVEIASVYHSSSQTFHK